MPCYGRPRGLGHKISCYRWALALLAAVGGPVGAVACSKSLCTTTCGTRRPPTSRGRRATLCANGEEWRPNSMHACMARCGDSLSLRYQNRSSSIHGTRRRGTDRPVKVTCRVVGFALIALISRRRFTLSTDLAKACSVNHFLSIAPSSLPYPSIHTSNDERQRNGRPATPHAVRLGPRWCPRRRLLQCVSCSKRWAGPAMPNPRPGQAPLADIPPSNQQLHPRSPPSGQ